MQSQSGESPLFRTFGGGSEDFGEAILVEFLFLAKRVGEFFEQVPLFVERKVRGIFGFAQDSDHLFVD